jgi:hypothetical protein
MTDMVEILRQEHRNIESLLRVLGASSAQM